MNVILLRDRLHRTHSAPWEAGAMAPRSAAAGLTIHTAADGSRWAANVLMGGQLQRIHTVTAAYPNNTLWGMATKYYGAGARWKEIYSVPQNKAIQGSDPNKGLYPGDEILIPNLTPPASLPGVTQTGGQPTVEGLPGTLPGGLPGTLPGGTLPTGTTGTEGTGGTGGTTGTTGWNIPPWPGTGGTALPGELPGTGTGGDMTTVSTGGKPATTTEEKFWTPTKIALAVGAGVVVVIGVAFAMSKRRRRNPRRRR